MSKNIKIGVLALQGDFLEHLAILNQLGVETCEVRLPADLKDLNGLIIPGGESTAISRLLHQWRLIEPIKQKHAQGMAIWGTCAGAILLAKKVANLEPPGLKLMDITIARNAFGRQLASFEIELTFPPLGDRLFNAVFIRAPIITAIGTNVTSLITLEDGTIVAARENKLLATSFHPELGNDKRFHQYFLDVVK